MRQYNSEVELNELYSNPGSTIFLLYNCERITYFC